MTSSTDDLSWTGTGPEAPWDPAALYRRVIENTPVVVYIDVYQGEDDSTETPIFVSPQVEKLLGWSPSEWIADPGLWRSRIHADDRERIEKLAADATESFEAEYRMIRRDGRTVWVREMASIIGGRPDGRIMWHGVMFDITAHKEAEAQRELQARLLQSISDAVISCDQDLRITSWNKAAQELYGWTAAEVMGKPMRDVLRYELSDTSRDDLWDPFSEDMLAWRGRALQHTKGGGEVTVETKGLPLRDSDGRISGYVMVNREVEA